MKFTVRQTREGSRSSFYLDKAVSRICGVLWQQQIQNQLGLPRRFSDKESACQWRRRRFDLLVRKIPWGSKWQPTPIFLPEKSRGQRSLADCSPWDCRVGHDLATKQQQQLIMYTQVAFSSFSVCSVKYVPIKHHGLCEFIYISRSGIHIIVYINIW